MSSIMFTDASLDALTEADMEIVARLGDVIWRSHYTKMLSVAQIDYMLAGRYTPDKLCRYFNADDCWLELLKLAGEPIGYCSYARTSSPNEMKLEQLYLLQEHRGKGLGGFMLRHIEVQARMHGLSVLMLQVNKRNVESIAFYHKVGFTVRHEAIVDIGNGFVMDDYVMVKML